MKYLLVTLLLTLAAAQNLIKNPSFEDNNCTNTNSGGDTCSGPTSWCTLDSTSVTLADWQVTAGTIDLQFSTQAVFEAHSGIWAVDLNGAGPGSVSQTVETTVGVRYLLRWWVFGNVCCGPSEKTLSLHVTGAETQPYTWRKSSTWQEQYFEFTATENLTTITFESTTPEGCGAAIDDVSLTEALEPIVIETGPHRFYTSVAADHFVKHCQNYAHAATGIDAQSTWEVLPGLNGQPGHYSFLSSIANNYLLGQDDEAVVSIVNPSRYNDASWIPVAGLADPVRGVSFQSASDPTLFLSLTDNVRPTCTNLADVRGVGRVFHPFDPVDRAAATFYRFSLAVTTGTTGASTGATTGSTGTTGATTGASTGSTGTTGSTGASTGSTGTTGTSGTTGSTGASTGSTGASTGATTGVSTGATTGASTGATTAVSTGATTGETTAATTAVTTAATTGEEQEVTSTTGSPSHEISEAAAIHIVYTIVAAAALAVLLI